MSISIEPKVQKIIALCLVGVIIYFMFQNGCNKAAIKICGFEIIQPVAEQLEALNKKHKQEVKDLIQLLDSANLNNRNLKDSIVNLIALRQKDINQVNYLLDDLKKVSSDKERDNWVDKAFTYLSKRYEDYYRTGKEMVLVDENGYLKADIATKDAEIRSLKQQVSELQAERKTDKSRIANLYTQIDSIRAGYEAIIAELKENAKINEERIALLESQKLDLEKEIEKIKSQLAAIVPFRIENFEFVSPNCYSRKDNSYILGCMKKVTLSFKINYNNPSETQNPQQLKIIFKFPTKDKDKTVQIPKTVTAYPGQFNSITIEKSEYNFVSGLYSAQILYDDNSSTIPIEMGSLYVKRIFEK